MPPRLTVQRPTVSLSYNAPCLTVQRPNVSLSYKDRGCFSAAHDDYF